MKVLNQFEIAAVSGGNEDDINAYASVADFYDYSDCSGLYGIFSMLNQRPENWAHYFAAC
jgi:hypothetical protein